MKHRTYPLAVAALMAAFSLPALAEEDALVGGQIQVHARCLPPLMAATALGLEGMKPTSQGQDRDGDIWILFVNDTGQWRIVMASVEHPVVCLIGSGDGWETVKPKKGA